MADELPPDAHPELRVAVQKHLDDGFYLEAATSTTASLTRRARGREWGRGMLWGLVGLIGGGGSSPGDFETSVRLYVGDDGHVHRRE